MGFWKRGKNTPENAVVTAAAGPVARRSIVGEAYRAASDISAWQDEVDNYDEHGPGFVGAYLDLVSDKVTSGGYRADMRGQPVTDDRTGSVIAGVVASFKNPFESSDDLIKRAVRLYAKLGEFYVFAPVAGYDVVAHPKELRFESDYVEYMSPFTGEKYRVPLDNIRRVWSPVDRNPTTAKSDIKRALPHIREYVNIKYRQDTDTTSPLVRNRILRFGGDDTEIYQGEDGDPYNGIPDAVVDYIKLGRAADMRQYSDKRRGQDTIPFPLVGTDVEVIDLGRDNDPLVTQLETNAILAFARSVRVPSQYIESGPGVAKFDNEDIVLEALITDALTPIGDSVFNDLWRVVFRERFVAVWAAMNEITPVQAAHYSLGISLRLNTDALRPKIDQTEKLIDAYRVGAAQRQAIADSLDTEPLELDPEMDEYTFWLQTGQRTSQATRPSNDWFNDVPSTAQRLEIEGHDVSGIEDTQTESEQVQAAAITANLSAANDIIAEATAVERELFSAITAATTAEVDRIIDEAARRLSRIAPSGSDLKKRLANIRNSADKLAAVTDEDVIQYQIAPEDLVPDDSFDRAAERFEDTANGILDPFVAGVLAATGVRLTLDVDAAATVYRDGMLANIRYRIGSGGRNISKGVTTHANHIRKAIATIGGGGVTDNAFGAVMSNQLKAAIENLSGTGMQWEWVHAMYRTPNTPDPVHQSLNGVRRATIDDYGGRYPGDHAACTCGFRMVPAP